ncbi:alpha/beta fold hydrolase [Aliikangiella maris]|uniref:Uncharacterized protein n=2 Tax=Aliikangiella maris TaxID=3162458 RepID=A0ABV2BYS2_9GAMM
MLKILLLPGLDGTGKLFKHLNTYLKLPVQSEVIVLNDIVGRTHIEQARSIAHLIGRSRVILIAESYSGRIAYELCRILNQQISYIIFIASFVSNPCRITELIKNLPEIFFDIKYIPEILINYFCFSGYGKTKLYLALRETMALVSKKIIKQRIHLIAKLQIPEQHYAINACYLRPSHDRLVSTRALKIIRECFPNLTVKTISGGHFIAQIEPKKCATIINKIIVEQGY